MGRNRRQERLRNRRERGSQESNASASGSGGSRSGGGALSSKPKPPWRETIDSWGGFTVIGAIALAIVIAGVLVFVNRPGSSANSAEFTARQFDVPVNGNVVGDPNAPVRIIEYGDFQCPHCENFFQTIEPTLMEEYVQTGKATFEFRNYAFIGPESTRAAEAALCAADQNQFWNFHDILFLRQGRENSGVFSDSNLKGYARTIDDAVDDFDYNAWESCFDAGTYEAQVTEENRSATNAGIGSTPTVLVNGKQIPGVQGIDVYRAAIDDALPADSGS
ncbi:MAG: thioredoxin domain-containing protein [Dehalococcoidia bacterium]|nr:thioredoxin domain-containing protein [Dehalococcoidia bacterium]MCA9849819.1 thioredoxin domain-containing protein [Dehalococcoidia bacterium]MCB9482632.1 thioredoxin domain-containing protein [Dehalococcoidia bacterium]MCB9491876.1 thioredoxin domain-containing protein [Dehalococcoidia bacterium]